MFGMYYDIVVIFRLDFGEKKCFVYVKNYN